MSTDPERLQLPYVHDPQVLDGSLFGIRCCAGEGGEYDTRSLHCMVKRVEGVPHRHVFFALQVRQSTIGASDGLPFLQSCEET